MKSSFLTRAAVHPKVLQFSEKELKDKLKLMESSLKAMEPQKDNPSVVRNYYTLFGKVEALKAVVSKSRHELILL